MIVFNSSNVITSNTEFQCAEKTTGMYLLMIVTSEENIDQTMNRPANMIMFAHHDSHIFWMHVNSN